MHRSVYEIVFVKSDYIMLDINHLNYSLFSTKFGDKTLYILYLIVYTSVVETSTVCAIFGMNAQHLEKQLAII